MSFLEGILYVIWRGFAIGVIISAPMGPVGILCVQRTLERGRRSGFFTGVGASISDLFYCLLTGFGLSFIEGFLKANQSIIQIVGSVVLIIFGLYLFKSTPARKLKKPGAERTSPGKTMLSGFLFTFSNPLIIFLIIGLFARFDFFLPEISFYQYVTGYLCIIAGALSWWWIVSFFVDKVRAHFNLRSMWLINKITGSIIILFAIVGIITAFTGKARAVVRPPLYLNSGRGFSPICDTVAPGRPLLLDNDSVGMIRCVIPLEGASDFSLTFRAANLHNRSGRKYAYTGPDGRKNLVSNPAWGLRLHNDADTVSFRFSTNDNYTNELEPLSFDLGYRHAGTATSVSAINNELDYFTGENSFLLRRVDESLTLFAGNRRYHLFYDLDEPGFEPDYIEFYAEPGASLQLDDIVLNVSSERRTVHNTRRSHFADEDVRNSYFSRSQDPHEGEWEIFDRMLEENELRSGGNYRLAMVKNAEGYDLVYLSGALKNPDAWHPGMIKANLVETSFRNVYDMIWLDPAGSALDDEIKVQFDGEGILDIQFPAHGSSSLRLRKIRK